ncbi:MAG: LuxR C-terminal-related transcriptional regulator [Leifsonia sp.]
MTSGQFIPAHAIDRPAARHRLDETLDQPLTLVVAQAGAGKSVLLTQWTSSHDLETIWIDVVVDDDDPDHFVRHLIDRLRPLHSGFAALAPVASVSEGGLGSRFVEGVVALLAEAPASIIVFDDLHHLSNAAILADLVRMVELLPANVHVVFSSRSDLPLAWSRLRVSGSVGEIRQAELAMSADESAEMLERIAGLSLDPESLAVLVEKTEGWAAGLQLVGITLRQHEDPQRFIADFGGSDRFVADYLTEEVIGTLSDENRRVILELAVFDRMSAELVAAVIGGTHAQGVFAELERGSMFLIPIDDRREWYRFHHLFRDLLRFRLRSEDPPAEAALLLRAAEWHLERDEAAEAVDYLLGAHEWERAIAAILGHGSSIFERGEMSSVIRWIVRIPESIRTGHVDLSLLLGILSGMGGQTAFAEDILHHVATSSTATPGQRACAYAFLAAAVQWRPRPETSVEVAIRALEIVEGLGDEPTPDILRLTDRQSLETITLISGGRAYFLAGELDSARDWLVRGLATEGAAYSLWRISGLGSLGLLEAWVGNAELAEDLAMEALALAKEVGALDHPATADAYLAMTFAAFDRGELGRAAVSLTEAAARTELNGRAQLAWICHFASVVIAPSLDVPEPFERPVGPPPRIVAERLSALSVPGEPTATRTRLGQPALAEPLTDREREILAYLPTHFTTTELADKCYVSVNTIKTHMAHIYRKLQVTSRRGAILRATELGLLPEPV